MTRKNLGLFLSALLAAAPGHSEDLLEIYNLALRQDPLLGEARARYEAEHTQLAQVRAQLLPNVSAQVNTSRNANYPEETFSYANGVNAHNYGVSIQQSVFNLQQWFNWQSARAGDRRAQATLMKSEQDMIMRVARAYFDVLRGQEALALAEAEVTVMETGLTNAQRRLEVGLAPITDVNFAQASRDLSLVNRLREERLLSQRRLALEAITNATHDQLEDLRDEFPIMPVEPASADDWVQTAKENSPDVREARFAYEASAETAKAQRAALLPVITAQARYGWTAPTQNPFQLRATEAQESATLGLTLTIPIFTGGANSSRMRQAYHLRNMSEQALMRVGRENERSTRDSFFGVSMDILAVQAGEQAVLSAQTALDSAQTGLEVGLRNAVDLVNAQRDLFRARRDLADARYNYVIDTLALKQAAGVLTPEDVRALNEWLQ